MLTEAPPMPAGWAWVPWSYPLGTCTRCSQTVAGAGYERHEALFCPGCAQAIWERDQARRKQKRNGHNHSHARRI
jgi:predicted RNA-binding Zn-ribbon protein involved in translation (DUF1610 family)